jgi:hypothetical protein
VAYLRLVRPHLPADEAHSIGSFDVHDVRLFLFDGRLLHSCHSVAKARYPTFPKLAAKPYNHLFFGSRFSPEGLRARKIAFLATLGLILFGALDFTLS